VVNGANSLGICRHWHPVVSICRIAFNVVVRTGPEIAVVLAANPFRAAAPNRTVAIFLKTPPRPNLLDTITGLAREEIAFGVREIYVHYPDGQTNTTLKIPAANSGTARNMNTVEKLAKHSP
jgi:uncharacterized protein (DUF1697 family)